MEEGGGASGDILRRLPPLPPPQPPPLLPPPLPPPLLPVISPDKDKSDGLTVRSGPRTGLKAVEGDPPSAMGEAWEVLVLPREEGGWDGWAGLPL